MLLVIIIVKCLLPSNASGEHISVHAHAIGWHLFAPLPRIIALFSTCVSVNFYPLCELDTIGSGRMDLIITYSSLPPNLTRCTSSQILLLSSSQMYTRLYFANSRKQRQGNTQGIWQEQCTIYCTAMLLMVLAT